MEKQKQSKVARKRTMSWWKPSRVWKVRMECRWHEKSSPEMQKLTSQKAAIHDEQRQPTSQNPPGGSPKQSTTAGNFCWVYKGDLRHLLKKMITKVLLILPLYLTLFLIWWSFRYLIKVMADVENIWNNDDFFGDTVDTPKEDIGQHRKREWAAARYIY